MLAENVSIVFHVAATVRFDEPIHDAIIKNVRGTREIVLLARQMKNLSVSISLYALPCKIFFFFVKHTINIVIEARQKTTSKKYQNDRQ